MTDLKKATVEILTAKQKYQILRSFVDTIIFSQGKDKSQAVSNKDCDKKFKKLHQELHSKFNKDTAVVDKENFSQEWKKEFSKNITVKKAFNPLIDAILKDTVQLSLQDFQTKKINEKLINERLKTMNKEIDNPVSKEVKGQVKTEDKDKQTAADSTKPLVSNNQDKNSDPDQELSDLRKKSVSLFDQVQKLPQKKQELESTVRSLLKQKNDAISKIQEIQKDIDSTNLIINSLNSEITGCDSSINELTTKKDDADKAYKGADAEMEIFKGYEKIGAAFSMISSKENESMNLSPADSGTKNQLQQSLNTTKNALDEAIKKLSKADEHKKQTESELAIKKALITTLEVNKASEEDALAVITQDISDKEKAQQEQLQNIKYKELVSNIFQNELKIFENLDSQLKSTIYNKSHNTYKKAFEGGYLKALSFRLFEITKKVANSSNIIVDEVKLQDDIVDSILLKKDHELTGFRIYQIIVGLSEDHKVDQKKVADMYIDSIKNDYDNQEFYLSYGFKSDNVNI